MAFVVLLFFIIFIQTQSSVPAQYLHFYRSILRVERTKKSLARNFRVLSVQQLLCLYTVCYAVCECYCAKSQSSKRLLFLSNVLLLPVIKAPFAMQ